MHELTLTLLSLFSPDSDLHQVLSEIASCLDLPVLLLWKQPAEQEPQLLCSVGLSEKSELKVSHQLKEPRDLLTLPLPELKLLSSHWHFSLEDQSPYTLLLLLPEPPKPALQSMLRQLGQVLHKALCHYALKEENAERVKRLQALLATSPDGLVLLTGQATVLSANLRAEILLGAPIKKNQSFMGLLEPYPKLGKMLQRWTTQTSPAGSHWEGFPGERVLEVRCVPVFVNNAFLYTLYIRDVTEIQRTSRKLRETTSHLEVMLAHLQMGIVLESREGQTLLINPSLSEMFTLSADLEGEEQAQQLHVAIADNLVDSDVYLTALAALKQEKKPFMGKIYACKNGRFVEHDAVPILFGQLLAGHLWVFRDVTDKVLAEADKRRLAQFPEKNPNPVLQINGEGQVLYANTPARYLLSRWHTDLHGYVPTLLLEKMEKAKQTGQTLLTDLPFGKRSFQALVVYFAQENLYHLYGTDITRLQEAEHNALAMRDQAIAASAAKSEFLAVMSHEIRTPLNAVLGMLELLHQQMLTPLQISYVESARGAGDSLLALINHILDFARLESGHLALFPQPFLLQPILEQCISVFRYKAEEKGLKLSYVLEPAAEVGFLGDAQRIRQVFFILVDNALKFTAKGYVQVLITRPEDVIVVTVEDTGIGMSTQQQAIVFERFQQADSSITREYGGTGLGLSIAQELVSLHGGEITLASTLGKGSQFQFTLPLPEVTMPVAEAADRTMLDPATYRERWNNTWSRDLVVLVVEDSPENRALIAAYLTDFPVELRFAYDGHAGIQAWKKHKPDLVLMDVQMPVLDGLSATRAIHQLSEVPPFIVALTADASESASQAALDAGCRQTLTKPLAQHTLLCSLDEISKESEFSFLYETSASYRFLPQFASIYPVFFNSRRQEKEKFAAMLQSNALDWEVLERSGHGLKGSGGSFGFPVLSAIGDDLERAAQQKDLVMFKQLYAVLDDYLRQVQPEIEDLLADLPDTPPRRL